MPLDIRAAVAHGINQPLTIETLQLADPGPGEVLIEVKASGLCHSDLHILDGSLPNQFPLVLGHEMAGIVIGLGEGVTSLALGDHVVPLFSPECKVCKSCTSGLTNLCDLFGQKDTSPQLSLRGEPIFRPARMGGFASHAVLHESAVAKIRKDAPFEAAFYAGCGVTTGVGAAMFEARVRPGSSVIVFGVGGIGINTIQGARLAGAAIIIAVDTNDAKKDTALEFGATHFVNPKALDMPLVEHLMALTGGGADYTFECVGNTDLMRTAFEASHMKWGETIVVGAAPFGKEVSLPPFAVLMGRKFKGTMFGGAKGRTDVPRVIDWYMDGKIEIDKLISHRITLAEINDGFDMMKRGESLRTVIIF